MQKLLTLSQLDRGDLGFLYLFRCRNGQQRLVKVGYTQNDPRQRLREIKTGCPFELHLEDYAVVPGIQIEGEVHADLAEYNTCGEWFDVPSDLALTNYVWNRTLPTLYELEIPFFPFLAVVGGCGGLEAEGVCPGQIVLVDNVVAHEVPPDLEWCRSYSVIQLLADGSLYDRGPWPTVPSAILTPIEGHVLKDVTEYTFPLEVTSALV